MNDEKTMPGFLTFREAAIMFALMEKNDAADAIKATCRYFLFDEIPELTGTAAKVFEVEKASIDDYREVYQKKVVGGKAGAEKRWGKKDN